VDISTLATRLDGTEYPPRFSKEIIARARESGLVFAYCVSDDNLCFDGAICDDASAYGGKKVRVDAKGIIPDFRVLVKDDIDAMRDFFRRENGGVEIEAVWHDGGPIAWTFETSVPHETFDIVENGDIFCRGIVFAVASLG